MKKMKSKLTSLCAVALLALAGQGAHAHDLGAEGQVFEIIEEDIRIMMMRLIARQDLTEPLNDLKASAENYTKNLTPYFLPRAESTVTRWKDVGIITTEDIYLPSIDWETGSVTEPQPTLAVKAGTYLNPIQHLVPAGIPRLFIFDATDEEQLSLARALMVSNITGLNFMITAGDLGPISKEMNLPVYHANISDLQRLTVKAVPTLIGVGGGRHLGHLAITEFKLPVSRDTVKKAWYGLPYPGYDPAEFGNDLNHQNNKE